MFSWHGGKRAYGPERRINAVSRRLVDTANACRRIGFRPKSQWKRVCDALSLVKATRETPAARVRRDVSEANSAACGAAWFTRRKTTTEGSPGSEV